MGFDTRETVEDVTRIMAGYHAVLAARVFSRQVVERMAAVSTVPVVNMLSDHSHPLQALADVLTMEQTIGPLAGTTVAWVGDYNNVARSLAEAAAMLGLHVRLGCPSGYDAPGPELERLLALGAASVEQHADPLVALKGADAVHTDVWTSMGQESEDAARRAAFDGLHRHRGADGGGVTGRPLLPLPARPPGRRGGGRGDRRPPVGGHRAGPQPAARRPWPAGLPRRGATVTARSAACR